MLLYPSPCPFAPCRYTVLSTDCPRFRIAAATRVSVWHPHKASNSGKGTERCQHQLQQCENMRPPTRYRVKPVCGHSPSQDVQQPPTKPLHGRGSSHETMDGRKGIGSFPDVLLCANYPEQHIRVRHGSVPVCRSPAVSPGSSAAIDMCKCWATAGCSCTLPFLCMLLFFPNMLSFPCTLSFLYMPSSSAGLQPAVCTTAWGCRGTGCSPTPLQHVQAQPVPDTVAHAAGSTPSTKQEQEYCKNPGCSPCPGTSACSVQRPQS